MYIKAIIMIHFTRIRTWYCYTVINCFTQVLSTFFSSITCYIRVPLAQNDIHHLCNIYQSTLLILLILFFSISAPVAAVSPVAAPPTKVPHLPVPSRSSEENSSAHSNLLTIIGICVGILIMIFVAAIIFCACSHCKSNKPLAEEAETCKFHLTILFCVWKALVSTYFNINCLL
jgi:magnesium-transporting ATPase (P-type)